MSKVWIRFSLLSIIGIFLQSGYAADWVEPIDSFEPVIQSHAFQKTQPTLKNSISKNEPSLFIELDYFYAKDKIKEDAGGIQIGYSRKIPSPYDENLISLLEWHAHPSGGLTASLTVYSPQAAALRLSVVTEGLPEGVELHFFNVTVPDDVFRSYTAVDFKRSEIFWSPTIEGDTVGVEIYIPPNLTANDLTLIIPALSHLDIAPSQIGVSDLGRNVSAINNSLWCNVDVQCVRTTPSNLANATALMIYVKNGGTRACTGTLLNDRSSTGSGYFMTASHCISNQTVASTIETLWFYNSSYCNSGVENWAGKKLLRGGATLLKAGTYTDFSLLQLRLFPPSGVLYSGVDANGFSVGSAAIGIHHPRSDLKKISGGNVVGYRDWNGSIYSGGSHITVDWVRGVTEVGSSGSAIFDNDGRFRGQLQGNTAASCPPNQLSYYGRFDYTFPHVKEWLWLIPQSVAKKSSTTGSVTSGGYKEYKVVLSSSETKLKVKLSSVSTDGNVNLNVRRDRRPNKRTGLDSDCGRHIQGVGEENCTLSNSGTHTYYIGIYGYANTSYTLTIGDSAPTPTPTPTPTPPSDIPSDWVHFTGKVVLGTGYSNSGAPVCAIVIANGQHMFSCDGQGTIDMYVPLNSDGTVTVHVFADGFRPKTWNSLIPAFLIDQNLFVYYATTGPELFIHVESETFLSNGLYRITGTISANGLPACTLMLVNGVNMFTCGENLGRFSIEAPIDVNKLTIFSFAQGYRPFKHIIWFYSPS